jgi:hypothetical protein
VALATRSRWAHSGGLMPPAARVAFLGCYSRKSAGVTESLASYIPPPPPPPSPPPCSHSRRSLGGWGVFGAPAWPVVPWAHPASANKTKSAASRLCQCIISSGQRSAGRLRLKDRPMSVRREKTDFIIVGHSHALAAGRTGILAYSLKPTALLFMLVAAMRARVAEENIQ